MAVPSSLSDLSTTAASNSPAGSESIGTSLDDYLRSIQAIIKQGVSKGSDIASASTITPVATSSYFIVTGTTGITAIGETYSWTGRVVVLKFNDVLTLTHSSGLILPGAANITTAAGHVASFVNESAGVWRCVQYNNGISLTSASIGVSVQGYVAPSTSGNVLTSNGSAWVSSAPASTGVVNDFRLTLTSGTPVTTVDVTGATTIYCTPYKGNQISLYSGSAWVTRSSAEFSLALGTLTSGKPYDVFCYDNSGTPTLEFLVWTNDTTRATALTYQDGVLVKSGATTRRYLGTFYTTAATTTEDSAANRYLWNYYNRVVRPMVRKESTSSWSYTTDTWRQANASTANQLNFVRGLNEDDVSIVVQAQASNGSNGQVGAAIGLDSTSSPTGLFGSGQGSPSGYGVQLIGTYDGLPSEGRHYAAWLERSQAVSTTTWTGTNANIQTGLSGRMLG